MRSERAQSTIEFVGSLPVLLLAALCCLQAFLLALGVVFAQSAADRAARGASRAQVADSVPTGWRSSLKISDRSGTVRVSLAPPALLPGTRQLLRVGASAEATP